MMGGARSAFLRVCTRRGRAGKPSSARSTRYLISAGSIRSWAPFPFVNGLPSIDPKLTLRMLILGYIFVIRWERKICAEVQVNLDRCEGRYHGCPEIPGFHCR